MKLGKNIHYNHHQSSKNCTKLWKEGKLWKLKKVKSRERKTFKSALNAISRQIVSFAESLGSGIKFEKLFSPRYSHRHGVESLYEFSFDNGSFYSLQQQVEKRAWNRGIPVIYVNPAYTSKRCCRCGSFGRRSKKRFECPHCGYVAHADVNAAFNIAAASLQNASGEYLAHWEQETIHIGKKELRRQIRAQAEIMKPALATTSLPVARTCWQSWNHFNLFFKAEYPQVTMTDAFLSKGFWRMASENRYG